MGSKFTPGGKRQTKGIFVAVHAANGTEFGNDMKI